MTRIFLFGTLLDPDLRRIVLGAEIEATPAHLPGWRVERSAQGDWPILVRSDGDAAQGLLIQPPSEHAARMDFYENGFDFQTAEAEVETDAGRVTARVYRAPGGAGSGTEWSLADWQAAHGPMTRLAATEVLGLHGRIDAEALRFRMGTLRARASSTIRAGREVAPTMLRADIHRDRVEVIDQQVPYHHFFAVAETQLRHPTFAGGMSAPMERAAFWMSDAVTVIPFDPVRRRVLLVEQFRYGAYLRGDPYPWILEPIAGRIDPGETPETAARREALEEARVELAAMHRIAGYYSGPGATSEFIDSYVGIADLPDGSETVAGVEGEHEDIRSHVLTLDAALDLIDTGEAQTGPLLLSLLWVDRALRRGTFDPA
ncbi:nudix-type nucleoside diphosphatase, YffH/AdpP family [Palleronia marisminoris]|uniref:ADP-ribose pyrophosphatase n=1 Tax=Palleronia marisminoris TaxID=315423 RepID=A0A1Y5TEX1_9RHOB|nr:NUDIX domain-containing protein [Palleronia marisminoris]SFH37314.1 nudix-type nucleoside diphosphatase, YffH/AdpP family [Palleronia marisminoris]SLN62551.1 ADP-ribose pyrophosphatase [Palleronia marisminoris]